MAKQSPILAPRRLALQIVQLQAFYYAIGLVLVTFTLIVLGLQWHAHYVFSWEDVRSDTSLGWLLALLWIMDTFFSVLAMALIVGRSKLALDFALTLHGINLVVAWASSHRFPTSWLWWATQIVSASVLIYLGRWASQWRELRRTFFEDYELADIDASKRRDTANSLETSDFDAENAEES